ncbi:MAG: hypothetical protein FWF75_07925 [Propionibacteriaceae bacterium]|nr:hypothetical protein [Propionibacteriaceae bacterium]
MTRDGAAKAGYTIVGLAGEADADIEATPGVTRPLLVIVGSEGEGLSRLRRERCDGLARIRIAAGDPARGTVLRRTIPATGAHIRASGPPPRAGGRERSRAARRPS